MWLQYCASILPLRHHGYRSTIDSSKVMAGEIGTDLFGFLCQLATLYEWHSPKFGTLDFRITEDALRKIFPWESSFTNVKSGSLSEKLYLPSLKAADETGSSWMSFETDLDIMFMPEKVMIKEPDLEEVKEHEDVCSSDVVAFIENSEAPRYVKLRVNNACKWKLPEEILEIGDKGDNLYISSSKFCETFGKHLKNTQQAGPSQLVTSEHIHSVSSFGIMESVDLVFAFRCTHWPSVAVEWVNRKRNWPPPEIIQLVIQEGCAAVAKGFPGSVTATIASFQNISLLPLYLRGYLASKRVGPVTKVLS